MSFACAEPPIPAAPPQLLWAGSTFLIVNLNVHSIVGDGPLTRQEVRYQDDSSPSSMKSLVVTSHTYKIWHLEPNTLYHIRVVLARPGEGGTGGAGPTLTTRTQCAGDSRRFLQKPLVQCGVGNNYYDVHGLSILAPCRV